MTSHDVITLFLDLSVIVLLARAAGWVAEKVRQPAVLGEIVAGIALGPTLLGRGTTAVLFPEAVRTEFGVLAQLGVLLFMFLIGCRFDLRETSAAGGMQLALGGALVPFVLGACVAWTGALSGSVRERTAFAVYIGVAMSVTAFPVLARLLRDRGLIRTGIGRQAIAAAAFGDLLAWTMLAGSLVLAGLSASPLRLALAAPFIVLLFGVVRPLLTSMCERSTPGRAMQRRAVVVAGLLASAAFTQWIGLDAIFGAFLFGLALPRHPAGLLEAEVVQPFGQIADLFLPVYFLTVGLTTDLSRVTAGPWYALPVILAVAVGGKALGIYPVARLRGMDRRTAGVLTVLLNTRGLTELVILGIGLRAGLLDQRSYTLMVAMAVLTTLVAGPALSLLLPRTQAAKTGQPTAAPDPAPAAEPAGRPD